MNYNYNVETPNTLLTAVRLPRDLHAKLRKASAGHKRAFSATIVESIKLGLAAKEAKEAEVVKS